MLSLFSRKRADATIERLYGAIVAQARHPAFYTAYGVSDTLDGRFDLLILHVGLFFRRARAEDETRAIGQSVFDAFCADMDHNLREIGIGDVGVPKQMRRMGEAFYGRAAAYDAALAASDPAQLTAALARNVYGSAAEGLIPATALAHYVRRVVTALASQNRGDLLRGTVWFPEPAGDERGGHGDPE